MKHKPSDYKATALWHKLTGSLPYYIKAMQERAAASNAPLDALFQKHGTTHWVCVSDLAEDHCFRGALAVHVKK